MKNLYDWYFYLKKLNVKYKKLYPLILSFKLKKYYKDIDSQIYNTSSIIPYINDLKNHATITRNNLISDGETNIITNLYNTVKIEYRGYITIELSIYSNYIKVTFIDSLKYETKEYYQNASIYGKEFHDSVNELIVNSIRIYYRNCINNISHT